VLFKNNLSLLTSNTIQGNQEELCHGGFLLNDDFGEALLFFSVLEILI